MKALLRNFLAKAESAFDAYWQVLTDGQTTYIGIQSQVPRKPAAPGVAENVQAPPDNARELCT